LKSLWFKPKISPIVLEILNIKAALPKFGNAAFMFGVVNRDNAYSYFYNNILYSDDKLL
jgi:hypothetical protein